MNMLPVLTYRPKTLWRISTFLLPVWPISAVIVLAWSTSWVVPKDSIALPVVDSSTDPMPVSDRSIESYSCIGSRSLREQLIEPVKPEPPKPVIPTRQLNLALVGTATEKNDSYALFKTSSGRIEVARLGSLIDSCLVTSITPDRVGLTCDGVLTYLMLPEPMRQNMPQLTPVAEIASAPASSSNPVNMTTTHEAPEEITQVASRVSLHNVSTKTFMDDVRLVPCVPARGRQVGFRMDSVAPGSELISAGLAPGDVIVSVDGRDLTRLMDMDRLYQSLEDGKAHRWCVLRGKQTLEVEIEQKKETAQ